MTVSRRPESRSALDLLALVLLWAPYCWLVRRFWFLNDDAFITFRYARNWANGQGLRYNLGSFGPEEGYSNFLWVAVSALFESLGLDVTFWVPVVSFLAGLALLALVYETLRYRFELARPVAILTALSLACFPPFAVWSTSGLETMPFALALFLTFERLALRPAGPAPLSGALAALSMALLRIDGVLWAVFVGLVAWLTRRAPTTTRRRPFAVYFTVVGTGFLVYTLARWSYFGELLPNPVLVKVKLRPDVLVRGYHYVATFYLTFLTPFLILPGILLAVLDENRRFRSGGVAIALLAVSVPAAAVMLGGDWMAMGRFFVAGLAFQTILLAWLVHAAWARWPKLRGGTVMAAAGSIFLALLPAFNVELVPRATLRRVDFMYGHPEYRELSEYERWLHEADRVRVKREEALALLEISKPGDSLVTGEIGAIGYYSGLYIYDRFGLVSRAVALEAVDFDEPLRSPGHDLKVSRDFFLKDDPTFITHLVLSGPRLRDKVGNTARDWKRLYGNMLWRRYVPDFAVMGGWPVAEADEVLMALRLIEEEPNDPLLALPRPERSRIRKQTASARWRAFYRKAAPLPND